ncbi:MAG: sulfatase-like hydrolase/transferase [Acidobacteriota bacterium]
MAASLLPAGPRAEALPPIILISIDTLRADYLPMLGASDVRTPALQDLARKGIVFTQAVTSTPLTLPAHTSLMTGTYPLFHGVRDNSGYRLPPEIPTLAETLQKRGYTTAAFVASAVLDHRFGLNRGFETYGDEFGETSVLRGVLAERRADEVVDRAIQWLRRKRSPRLFLWVHLYDPHAPYEAPGSFLDRGYKGEIEYVDGQIARLFEELKKQQLLDSSLIVVVSDHGEDLNQHGEPTHGFFIYDTVLRIPLIVKLPANLSAGTRVEDQVRLIDVAPTILQVLRIPDSPVWQGKGLLGAALGKRAEQLESYSETLYPSLHFGWSSLSCLRAEGFKFIQAPQPELYNLREDPEEKRNLYASRRALANQFGGRLRTLRSQFAAGRTPQKVELDPELRERLGALGYLTLSTDTPALETASGADPKEKIGVYAEVYRGMEAYTGKSFRRALAHFKKAVSEDSLVPLAHDYLGSTYLALDDTASAISAYKKAAELAPRRAEIVTNLAYAYLKAGQLGEAASGFQLATQLDSANWQPWQLLGVTFSRQGQVEAAVQAFEQALSRSSSNRQVLFNLGTLRQQQGKFLLAVEIFRKLVDVAPRDAEAWNSLGTNYQGAGLADSAEKAYQKAIALRPDYPSAYYNYGNLLAQKGEFAAAESHYRKALESDPDFALAHHNLSIVLERLGRTDEAAKERSIYQRLTHGSD